MKIHPMRQEMKDRAKSLLAQIEFAGEIPPELDRDYVVKGWFDRAATSVVYGDANVGKSFWAIDVAHHVHEGLPWNGRRVRRGAVLYIAAEGGAMFANRLAARKARFMVLRAGLVLTGRGNDAGPLAETLEHLSETHGPFALVIADTMARVMGAADENAAPDVAQLMAATDHIRRRTGAHVMLIHHSGKDATRGARGHSSLRAAVDTEVELSKADDGGRMARTTKQRDMPGGAEHRFTLEPITLGTDSDGDPVTSCIIKTEEGTPHRTR